MTLTVATVSVVAAAVAAVWPYVPRFRSASGLSAADRAGWVNRLFALAAIADEAGESQVAEAARQLIATLVHQQQPSSRKGR